MRAGFQAIAQSIGEDWTPEAVADGFIRVGVENMANAIKKISVQRGYDVTEYALNCFGSAGGQHACLIADTLGMETILIHPLSGLLSAYGIGCASLSTSQQRSIEKPLSEASLREAQAMAKTLIDDNRAALTQQGADADCLRAAVAEGRTDRKERLVREGVHQPFVTPSRETDSLTGSEGVRECRVFKRGVPQINGHRRSSALELHHGPRPLEDLLSRRQGYIDAARFLDGDAVARGLESARGSPVFVGGGETDQECDKRKTFKHVHYL